MRKIFVETSIPFSRRRTIISSVPFSFIAASISEVNAASVMIMSTSSNLQIFTRLPFPNLLKAIRLLGDEKTQGRMFGFLEMGRGIVDVIVVSGALTVFRLMGEDAAALRGGLIFLSAVTASAGALCLIFVPNDEKRVDENGKEANKAQAAFSGMILAVQNIDIWAVGMYGIANQYGLKMIGGPIGAACTLGFGYDQSDQRLQSGSRMGNPGKRRCTAFAKGKSAS